MGAVGATTVIVTPADVARIDSVIVDHEQEYDILRAEMNVLTATTFYQGG